MTLVEFLVGGDGGGGEFLVEIEHALDEGDHLVVAGDVGGVVEVDGADGELPDELGEVPEDISCPCLYGVVW